MDYVLELVVPFIGTTIGAALVFFIKDKIHGKVEKALLGFASGVMVAASIWSLLLPSLELSSSMGKLSFLPTVIGFLIGIGFLLLLDYLVPHIHTTSGVEEGKTSKISKTSKIILAISLHNVPEGMAVGVAVAGAIATGNVVHATGALALAIGIAIQNVPEGTMVAIPFRENGNSKIKSFFLGSLSGLIEPIAALATTFVVSFVESILSYVLAFAAGAMIYVVIEELIPDSQKGKHSNIATVAFALGFCIMLILENVVG